MLKRSFRCIIGRWLRLSLRWAPSECTAHRTRVTGAAAAKPTDNVQATYCILCYSRGFNSLELERVTIIMTAIKAQCKNVSNKSTTDFKGYVTHKDYNYQSSINMVLL